MTTHLPPSFTAAQREQFTRFPQIDERTLSRHSLLDLFETLTDAVLDMHDRVMVSLRYGDEREAAQAFGQQGPTAVEQLSTYKSVCAAIIAAREQGADPYQAVEAVVDWQRLVETVRDERNAVSTEQLDPLHHVLKGYKITDLLLEVNAWTRFTGAFLNLHSGKGVERHDHLLTAILADGLNLGLHEMAEASPDPGVTARRLMYLADWFVRPDSYAAGLAELVNFQSMLPLAAL